MMLNRRINIEAKFKMPEELNVTLAMKKEWLGKYKYTKVYDSRGVE